MTTAEIHTYNSGSAKNDDEASTLPQKGSASRGGWEPGASRDSGISLPSCRAESYSKRGRRSGVMGTAYDGM